MPHCSRRCPGAIRRGDISDTRVHMLAHGIHFNFIKVCHNICNIYPWCNNHLNGDFPTTGSNRIQSSPELHVYFPRLSHYSICGRLDILHNVYKHQPMFMSILLSNENITFDS